MSNSSFKPLRGLRNSGVGRQGKLNGNRIFAILSPLLFLGVRAEGMRERSDWRKFFQRISSQRHDSCGRRTPNRSCHIGFRSGAVREKRYSPASTFKIPHTLFALDAGAARDEFQSFPMGRHQRSFAAHNQDQDLRSAMRNSTVWIYELFAKEIGEDKARRYLKQIDYGNADPSVSNGDYWIDGNLAIAAQEQIAFLRKLYHNELPFRVEHQRLVKDLVIVEAGRNWILRAKTGWEGRMGWWVGWVEWPTGPVFFALNIDTPNRMDDLFKGGNSAGNPSLYRSVAAQPGSQLGRSAIKPRSASSSTLA